ncbi:extracellular solute-binding protein [Haladaptatus sp. AB618]|uniref:extracellular solute-binding protein n=1 Tax=Haladaptatus sp. AB618 TaxID=2934173 RepID=UPI00209C2116|nr:extracellular solute-binding protein [Haladaptatus sp. AB618]MCO8255250.1 extracellular solute-binding protein [Haladaptatus sp. AB618]
MSYPRRKILQTGGAVAGITLAGCISVNSDKKDGNGDNGNDGGGGDGNGGNDGNDETTGGTGQLWHSRPKGPKKSLESNVKKFEGQSDYAIKLSEISDLQKTIENKLPAGKGPHLFQWAHDWIGEYQPAGFLSDQSDKLSVDLESTYTSAAAEAVQFDGETLGLPYAAETVALLYNKDMVDEPPQTVAEMQSIMEEHHDPSNGKYGLSFPIDPYFISGYAQAFGGYYYDEKKDELGLAKSETLKGFRFVRDELAKYIPKDQKYDPQAAVFNEGNAPLAINGPWYLGTVRDKGLDVGVAPLPKPKGGKPKPYTGVKMWYFAKKMNEENGNTAAARKFTEWHTTNTDLLLDLAKDHGFIPVHKDLAGSDDLPPAVKGFSESVQMGEPMPTAPHMQKVWDPVKSAFLKVLKGKQDAKPAFEAAEKTIKQNWD